MAIKLEDYLKMLEDKAAGKTSPNSTEETPKTNTNADITPLPTPAPAPPQPEKQEEPEEPEKPIIVKDSAKPEQKPVKPLKFTALFVEAALEKAKKVCQGMNDSSFQFNMNVSDNGSQLKTKPFTANKLKDCYMASIHGPIEFSKGPSKHGPIGKNLYCMDELELQLIKLENELQALQSDRHFLESHINIIDGEILDVHKKIYKLEHLKLQSNSN